MVSLSDSQCSNPGSFPGRGEVADLLFNYLEGFNEGIIGRKGMGYVNFLWGSL